MPPVSGAAPRWDIRQDPTLWGAGEFGRGHVDDRFASHELRMYILDRDEHRCRYCGRYVAGTEAANIDHVVPWPEGPTRPSNLVTACRQCNREKGSQRWVPGPLPADPVCPCGNSPAHRLSTHRADIQDQIRRAMAEREAAF